jgi:hypothetical protein
MTESSNESVIKETIGKVTNIVSLYAVMINGHLVNSELPVEERIAGVLCAGDLVKQATSLALIELCKEHGVSPSWVLGDDEIKKTAAQFAERMAGK